MESIIIVLLILINLMIIIGTSVSRDMWKSRCNQLKKYITFIETSSLVEDEHEGGQWLEERAIRREECDIQDNSYQASSSDDEQLTLL